MGQLRLWLNEHGIHCVGEYTCPGREINMFKMKNLGDYLGMNTMEATAVFDSYIQSVSYTHLDVYKRQEVGP